MSRYWFGDISSEMEAIEERLNMLMVKHPDPSHVCVNGIWNDPEAMIEEWHKTREELLQAENKDQQVFKKLLYYRWDLNCRLDMFEEVMDEESPDYNKQVWEVIGMLKAGRVFRTQDFVNFSKAYELCKDTL